jgi:hypothetical protein
VIAVAGAREDWPVARVVAMLQECAEGRIGPSLAAALIEELRSGGAALPRLLRLLRAAPAEALRGAVLQVLALAQAPETLAGALDALWHPEDAAHARRLVAHPEWFVRLAAAKALGRIGTAEDEPRLTALLGDPSWWVRYRAAQSLAALPGMGKAALEALRQAPGMDRFAADILGQVIAEQGAT